MSDATMWLIKNGYGLPQINNTISGLERLSGDYNRGYTKAIQDMMHVFEYTTYDLNSHKKNPNKKTMEKLFKCFLQSRELIREGIYSDGFIRWNTQKDDFEYYIPKRSK